MWQAMMMVRQCNKAAFWRKIVYVLLQSILPIANLYVLKLLIDSIEQIVSHPYPTTSFVPYLLIMCGIYLANRIVGALSAVNNDVLSQMLIDYLSDKTQRQAAILDMSYYDNPQYYDTLHRAQQEVGYRPLQIINNTMGLIGATVSIVGVVALLWNTALWIVGVMVLAVLPGFALRLYKSQIIYRFRKNNTQTYRQTSYFSALLTGRDFAKEMRAYNLSALFRERYVGVRRILRRRLTTIIRKMGAIDIVCGVVESAAMLLAMVSLIGQTTKGAISIGSFVMLFEAFRRGVGYIQSWINSFSGLYDSRLFISNLFEFLRLKPQIVSPADALPFPKEITCVEFHNVTFRYPDMRHNVLEHYSMRFNRGKINVIEGENGYGKSTVVKLLLRFYDPDEGAITVNGIDIRQFNLEDLRKNIGTIFQDFVRYNSTLRENVTFGASGDDSKDIERVIKAVGVDKIASRLEKGLDTPLGKMFDGGNELSMGQWQRVALARMLYSNAKVLVMDEPMAWLDTESRQEVNMVMDALKEEKLIIVINHR